MMIRKHIWLRTDVLSSECIRSREKKVLVLTDLTSKNKKMSVRQRKILTMLKVKGGASLVAQK